MYVVCRLHMPQWLEGLLGAGEGEQRQVLEPSPRASWCLAPGPVALVVELALVVHVPHVPEVHSGLVGV